MSFHAKQSLEEGGKKSWSTWQKQSLLWFYGADTKRPQRDANWPYYDYKDTQSDLKQDTKWQGRHTKQL